MNTPFLPVVAGPNGVGKSTFAEWYLQLYPDCIMIVDPDAIARELHYVRDEERQIKAARIAIERINLLIEQRISFAIETTMSGRTLASNLHRARSEGYYIAIVLLWVPSVRITAERVEMRVASGGHDIPLMDQLRRFDRSYINFFSLYQGLCHEWRLFNGIPQPAEEIASGSGGFAQDGSVVR
jgi:predicted ABC-type ATPase